MLQSIHLSAAQLSLIRMAGIIALSFVIIELGVRALASPAQSVKINANSQEVPTVQVEPGTMVDQSLNAPATTEPHASASTASSGGSVSINGRTFMVLGDGELHQTINDDSGQTRVDISVHSSSSGDNHSSSSSSNVQLHTESSMSTQNP